MDESTGVESLICKQVGRNFGFGTWEGCNFHLQDHLLRLIKLWSEVHEKFYTQLTVFHIREV